MKSINFRFIAHRITLGLTILPFILAGWIFASWLAGSALAAGERASLVIVDPPQEFYGVEHRLGFKVTDQTDLPDIGMTTITVRVPKGHHPRSAALLLRNSIPELVVDGTSLGIGY